MQFVNHVPNNQTMLPILTPIKWPMYVSLKFLISISNTSLCIKNFRVTVKCLRKLFNNFLGHQEIMIYRMHLIKNIIQFISI